MVEMLKNGCHTRQGNRQSCGLALVPVEHSLSRTAIGLGHSRHRLEQWFARRQAHLTAHRGEVEFFVDQGAIEIKKHPSDSRQHVLSLGGEPRI